MDISSLFRTSSLTSPTKPLLSVATPASTTTAPFFTKSFVINPGDPVALTIMSAVLFYQRSIGRDYPTAFVGALSLAIMGLTFYGSGLSVFALFGSVLYGISFFIAGIPISTILHVLGLLIF